MNVDLLCVQIVAYIFIIEFVCVWLDFTPKYIFLNKKLVYRVSLEYVGNACGS